MASNQKESDQGRTTRVGVKERIDDILGGIRVPELPYPVGKVTPEQHTDWRPLLMSCWQEQRDEQVTQLLRSVSITWTARQVNASYIADRIMDVFLRTSGLHPTLIQRVARLRYLLAWRLASNSETAFEDSIREWLDGLADWRGWSDSGGRSSRVLLDQLDALKTAVADSFEEDSIGPFEQFAREWMKEAGGRHERSEKLHQRLLDTEKGAARQRRAEQTARALVGRALSGRSLPAVVTGFILDYWLPLLRQIAWNTGPEGDDWRHAGKLLEWLVWIGDPGLSDKDRNRLYQVGEQLGDRISEVWSRIQGKSLPGDALADIESVMVARLRGETPDREQAIPPERPFPHELRWLTATEVDNDKVCAARENWYLEGEGANEQRRYFLDLLGDTGEVLWTNGFGVKLGLMPWSEFLQAKESGYLKPLPPQNQFGSVLADTVEALGKVLDSQRRQREKAAAEAKARAEALRKEKEAAEKRQKEQEAARAAELERLRAEEEAQRLAKEETERLQRERELMAAAQAQVDGIKLGAWISLDGGDSISSDGGEASPVRLKLAVRINASRKLVFVDRLGLNRTEYIVDELVQKVAAGEVRVLGSAAEFDDALSRVVGRIRVGRS